MHGSVSECRPPSEASALAAPAPEQGACAADPEVDAKLTRIDRAYQAELSRLTHQVGKPAHK